MKPVVFHFYLYADCIGADGNKPDYAKLAMLQPLDSIRARPDGVFRMHLNHLGFFISRHRPDLEGKVLDVELVFQGNDHIPKTPVLVAHSEGNVVARRVVQLQTLDTSPFLSLLLRRKPHLKGVDVLFTVTQTGDAEE